MIQLSEKERGILARFGWSISSGKDQIVLDSSTVGNDFLFVVEGSVSARGASLAGNEQCSIFHSGQLIGRVFFNCEYRSLRIMPASVCLLFTQESLEQLAYEEPKLAAKIYRRFALALVQYLVGHQPCADPTPADE